MKTKVWNRHNTAMKSRREKVWEETNGRCVYCNEETPPEDRTRDHLWPKSRGGKNHCMNLVPACRACNEYRGNRFPASRFAHTHWLDYVRYKEEEQRLSSFSATATK
jgi:5-methylcytosine-specific restriction endonuclease McrA